MLLTPSLCHKLSHLFGPLPFERDVLYGRPSTNSVHPAAPVVMRKRDTYTFER